MSLKKPYLDVRDLSPEAAYKLISECLDKHYAYSNKKAIPPYRCQQILNAINHSSLSEEQKSELRLRVQRLREARKLSPNMPFKIKKNQHQKEVQKANKKRQKNATIELNNSLGGTSTMWKSDRVDLPNPQPAHIIYNHNGPKR